MDWIDELKQYSDTEIAAALAQLTDTEATLLLGELGSTGQAETYESPGHLMTAINPKLRLTPALKVLNSFLMEAVSTPDSRSCVTFAPQEGKSTTVSVYLPIIVLMRNPDTRVIIAAASQSLAETFSRQIRDIITANPQLGLRISPGLNRQDQFKLDGHTGGVVAVGVGGTLNGKPGDLLIIDDPNKDFAEASSPTISQKIFEWYQGTAAMRLSPGSPVIVLQTRWHENDLIGRLLKNAPDRWRLLRIPAQADHRPEHGETDPLGREPGEWMDSARGRTREQWEQRKREAGPRMFAAQFQGTPAVDEGGIFPRTTWQFYPSKLTTPNDGRELYTKFDADTELIQSWDMAFKGGDKSDFVVGQVWLRKGANCYLLDQVRGRWPFSETLQQVRLLSAKYPQALTKLVEDKANGPAAIDMLRRDLPGVTPVNPHGGKEARANAVSPLVHAGNVHLPDPSIAPWVGDLIEEAALFPASSNDDQVDALTQALNHLMVRIVDNKKATYGMVAID